MTETLASYGVDLSPSILKESSLIGDLLSNELPSEIASAMRKHNPPKSGHEVYGVVYEELQEFFDHVRSDTTCLGMPERELLHVAVTALRGAAMYRRMRAEQS